MNVDIHTSDPDAVDPAEVAAALNAAGYFVISVDVNDGERTWEEGEQGQQQPLDAFDIDVKVKVPAASAGAAAEFVERTLSHETSLNPALEVISVTVVGRA